MFVLLVPAPAVLLGMMSFSRICIKIHGILKKYFVSFMYQLLMKTEVLNRPSSSF